MLLAARNAIDYARRRTRDDLDNNSMFCSALAYAVQQIGEAAANTSDEARARVPGLPWGQIVAMRHILVHVYWGVDRNRLWVTVTEDLPVLIELLERACENWPLPSPPSP